MSDELTDQALLNASHTAYDNYRCGNPDDLAKLEAEWRTADEAVLSRMSSPSHDRAMAEGGWQDISSASLVWLNRHLASVLAPDGICPDDERGHRSWSEIRRALSPTPTTKEETDK
jgi:hypothetical protein